MPQIVTPENQVEFIQTGKVPEFKAPEAPKVEVKPNDPVTTEVKTDTKAPEVKTDTPPRGEDGKFKAAEPEKADKPADEKKVDADADVVLTKKIERLINKKHREMKEAQEFGTSEARRAIAAEQRAADLQRQIDELQGKKSDPNKGGANTDTGDEPKPEDFKTVGEYTRALVKYEARLSGEQGRKQAAVSQQQAKANEVIGQFVERQEAFKSATPDYEEVLESADFDVPPITQQYLVESELGPQLAYHLAKNPEVVASLRKLSPARQLAELGKLEMKFEKPAPATAAAPSNGISKAPAPIQPLDAKSTPVQKKPEEMSFQELREFRRSEERSKRA